MIDSFTRGFKQKLDSIRDASAADFLPQQRVGLGHSWGLCSSTVLISHEHDLTSAPFPCFFLNTDCLNPFYCPTVLISCGTVVDLKNGCGEEMQHTGLVLSSVGIQKLCDS